MRRALATTGFVLILLGFATPVSAQPVGTMLGVEICPQETCGAAVFYGGVQFTGVPELDAGGDFIASLQVAGLPEPGNLAVLTGGGLFLRVGTEVIAGSLLVGWVVNNGDNTLSVSALFFTGFSFLAFQGTYDGNPSPSWLYGTVTPLLIVV